MHFFGLCGLVRIAAQPIVYIVRKIHPTCASSSQKSNRIAPAQQLSRKQSTNKRLSHNPLQYFRRSGVNTFLNSPNGVQRSRGIERQRELATGADQLGRFLNGQPHVPGVVQDPPRIDDVECAYLLRCHIKYRYLSGVHRASGKWPKRTPRVVLTEFSSMSVANTNAEPSRRAARE